MKGQQVFKLVAGGMLAVVAAGCATTGYDRAGRMANDLLQTQQDVQAARSQVTSTIKALDMIMRAEVGDLRPLLKTYSDNLATLGKMADNAGWRAQNIKDSGATYFSAWAQEIEVIQDPQVRANSLKRREQAMGNYREVEQSLVAVRDAYRPLMKDLLDIEVALQQDLTASGVASVKTTQQDARKNAIALQSLMKEAQATISRVRADLAPVASK